MITEAALFVAQVVVGGIVGSVIHELAHLVVARLAGRDARLDLRALEVRFTVDRLSLADRLAALAPQVTGLLLMGGWLLSGMPALPFAPALAAGWVTLTLLGSTEDYRVGVGGERANSSAPADSSRGLD